MIRFAAAALALLCASLHAADEPLRTAADRPVDVRHIRLDLAVDLPAKTVRGTATLDFTTLRPVETLSLDAAEFKVESVTLGERKAEFRREGEKLHITMPETLPAGQEGKLVVKYLVSNPSEGLYFFGPTAAEPETPLMVWSQGESVTNRYWFPSIDEPAEKQTTELVVTAADGFDVLSNGKLLDKRKNADGTVTHHWRQAAPHVSYLVTLVVGKFDVVREDWNGMPVEYWVPAGKREPVARSFGRTREMLDFFSKRYGIHYPWEKYAQVVVEQFSGGGMENTSATTLTDRALHDERSFLDSNSDGLIAHELAHQWWGDLVTCRDWAHLWLNEGFASYAEVLWSEYKEGADEAAYELVRKGRAARAGGKERPVVDRRYAHSRLMFDARAYPKGAWVLHMLRKQLGDDAYFLGLKTYGTEHKYQSVETTDLRRTLERVSGRSLERFFFDWTERPGHPVLSVTTTHLPEQKQLRLTVKQTQSGEPFRFPLAVEAHFAGDKVERMRLDVNAAEQTLLVPAPSAPRLVALDPGQEVLAEFNEDKARDLWAAELTGAAGVANRVRAAEHFGKSKTPADRELLAASLKGEKFWAVASEIASALGESGGDSSRDALVSGLIHENPKVRRACATALGKFAGEAPAADALKALLKKGDPSYYVEAAAIVAYGKVKRDDAGAILTPWLARASQNDVLRAAALSGLAETGSPSVLDSLSAWTQRGKSRESRTAALSALGTLYKKGKLSPEDQKRLAAILAGALEGETAPVRRAALLAMKELGPVALPFTEKLEAIVAREPDARIGEMAKAVLDAARKPAGSADVTKLREELDALKKQMAEIQQSMGARPRRQ